jgi:hypothetical protein
MLNRRADCLQRCVRFVRVGSDCIGSHVLRYREIKMLRIEGVKAAHSSRGCVPHHPARVSIHACKILLAGLPTIPQDYRAFQRSQANRAGRSAHRGALLVTSGYRGRLGPDSGLTGDVGADPVVAGAAALAGGW